MRGASRSPCGCRGDGVLLAALAAGCSSLDVGSDLLWTARFETGDFSEWTGAGAADAQAFPMPPNMIAVSNAEAHHGSYSAALTITAGSDGDAGERRRSRAPAAFRPRPTTAPGTTCRTASRSGRSG